MVVFYQRGVIICSPTSSFCVHPWFLWSRQSMLYVLYSPMISLIKVINAHCVHHDFSDHGNQCTLCSPWFLWSRQSMLYVLYSPMISLIKVINAHCVHHDFSDQGNQCTLSPWFFDQGNQCTLYSPMISPIKALRTAHGTVAFNYSWIIRHVLTMSRVHAINSSPWLADQLLCSLALNISSNK